MEDERPDNAIARWFADPYQTNSVHKVGPGYTSEVERMGGSVIRSATPPPGVLDTSEIERIRTAYLPRWRAGGVEGHEDGSVCPLCWAGYVYGRVEQMTHPDLAALCYACQVEIEARCIQVAAAVSKAEGRMIRAFDVITRFFGELFPITPLARRYGHAYEFE